MERQPAYRRPSWARNEKSYKYYMRKDLAADRSPGSDFGLGSFSYDADHLIQWQMPDHLCERVPQPLADAVTDWEHAGAAICTALDRINKLDKDAIHRAYPEKKAQHLSRRPSQSPAVVGAETPPMSSPDSPSPAVPSLDKLSFEGLPQRRVIGMESPPFTPIDSKACPTPEKTISPAAMPDALQLARQLSPLSTRTSRNSTGHDSAIAMAPVFDENAWDTYLNTFRAEHQDLEDNAWPRLRGYGYTIDRMRVELSQKAENRAVLEEFQQWWTTMKPKVAEYEKHVREIEEPRLEVVQLERKAAGLPC